MARRALGRNGTTQRGRRGIGRRGLLLATAALLAAAALGWWTRWFGRRPGKPQVSSPGPTPNAFLPPDARPLLLAVADAIVPRHGPHPGAGEIELLPRVERCIEVSAEGRDFYRQHWRAFERALRQRVPFQGQRPDPEALRAVLEEWHREYHAEARPSVPAGVFESLRRNVLFAYYTSPEGWASLGYAGPVRVSHPDEALRG